MSNYNNLSRWRAGLDEIRPCIRVCDAPRRIPCLQARRPAGHSGSIACLDLSDCRGPHEQLLFLPALRAIVRVKMPPTSIARGRSSTGGATDRASLLRTHPLFCELTPPILERISAYIKRRSVPKGGTIFEKGDAGVGLIGVVSGSVKISVTSADGRDIVLNIIQSGEVFGEIALLDGRARTANATAMFDCELIVIERREFIPFLRTEPDVTLKLMEILCSRLRKTSEQVQDVTFLNLPARLAKILLRLAATAGPSGKVAITQREISQIIGRSRESTNKRLRAWAKRGWIRLERGSVTLMKTDKLVEFAATSSDLDPS